MKSELSREIHIGLKNTGITNYVIFVCNILFGKVHTILCMVYQNIYI